MKARRYLLRLENRTRSLGRRWGGRAVVLLYHRVAEGPSDPQHLKVSPAHFRNHLEALRAKGFEPVRIGDLPRALRSRTWGDPPLFAVTFDDGYADNLLVAGPILEQARIPATVYVTVSGVDHSREMWWDELERLLLLPEHVPERLSLEVNGRVREWRVSGTTGPAGWNVLSPPRTEREQVYVELAGVLHHSLPEERTVLLDRLRAWAGVEAGVRTSVRTMTKDELRAMAAHPWFDIGAHTMNHPMLSALNREEQEKEIRGSKAALEALLQREIVSFAYPYGRVEDYNSTSVALVRAAGFKNACSNFPGIVHRFTDPFQLPRLCVYDGAAEEFVQSVESVLFT